MAIRTRIKDGKKRFEVYVNGFNARGTRVQRKRTNIESLRKAEVIEWGEDGCFVAFGTLLSNCLAAAKKLRAEGINVGVINARFVKPLDEELVRDLALTHALLVTVEENVVMGGAGSAVIESLERQGCTVQVLQLGLPDRFIEQGDPAVQLASVGLDAEGIAQSIRTRLAAMAAGKVAQRS